MGDFHTPLYALSLLLYAMGGWGGFPGGPSPVIFPFSSLRLQSFWSIWKICLPPCVMHKKGVYIILYRECRI